MAHICCPNIIVIPSSSSPRYPYTTRFRPATKSTDYTPTTKTPNTKTPWSKSDTQEKQATSSNTCGTTTASNSPDRKSTRLNSSHVSGSYAVFCVTKLCQELCGGYRTP